MNSKFFNGVTSEYYIRKYQLKPELFGGHAIEVQAECRQNIEYPDDGYYGIELYFSADGYEIRDFIVGFAFGESEMHKDSLDAKIDNFVEQEILNQLFEKNVEEYLELIELWERHIQEKLDNENK